MTLSKYYRLRLDAEETFPVAFAGPLSLGCSVWAKTSSFTKHRTCGKTLRHELMHRSNNPQSRCEIRNPASGSSISRRDCLAKVLLPLIASLPFSKISGARAGTEERQAAILTKDETDEAVQALREVTGLQDLAFEYTNRFEFEQAEILWTKIIELKDDNAAAFSNRGNCRTSQGKFRDAVADFDRAIALAPDEPDPQLGKGVALEGLHDYEGALTAYRVANDLSKRKYRTEDAVAINNMGNALGALGDWKSAANYYRRAANLDSHFAFALANEAVAMFQLGDNDDAAVRKMRFLTRKYPRFSDMHAAVAMALWESGDLTQAESEWFKAIEADNRYDDIEWVRDVRRWPPRLLQVLEKFRAIDNKQ